MSHGTYNHSQYCTLSFSSWKYSSVHIRITEPLQGMPTPVVVQENYVRKASHPNAGTQIRAGRLQLHTPHN